MAKVYVITSGEYSDYHICAVTLDPQKAEQLKRIYDTADYTGAEIEEYDTEQTSDLICDGYRQYYVVFKPDGGLYNICDTTEWYEKNPGVKERYGKVAVTLWAKDEQSAIKIAAEKRAKHLAEEEGIV